MVVQYRIKALFGGRSSIGTSSLHVYLPNLLGPYGSLKWRLHMREGVKVHDVYCGPKSYKIILLGKLVVQQIRTKNLFKQFKLSHQYLSKIVKYRFNTLLSSEEHQNKFQNWMLRFQVIELDEKPTFSHFSFIYHLHSHIIPNK